MRTKQILSGICCCCLLVGPMWQQRDQGFLDLTKPRPPQKERGGGRGEGGSGGGGDGVVSPRRVVPVRVTLLSLDKDSYQLGDQVIYEVMLENITNATLVIPWSDDYDRVKPDEETDPPGYLTATLYLVLGDRPAYDPFTALQGIYGSRLVSGSLKKLLPGQTVRIRAPGTWWFYSEDEEKRVLAMVPHTFEVRARFTLQDRPINPRYEPALSANSLAVELTKRQQ
jgi:hypothetical protein